MTIRRATTDDIPALEALARQEHAQSSMAATPFDAAVVRHRFTQVLTGLASAVFVHEKDGQVGGLIAGMAQPNLHNRFTTVFELLWFAVDGSGMKLLLALKAWANKMRATAMVAHNYAGIVRDERFSRALSRFGFTRLGASYMTTLEN